MVPFELTEPARDIPELRYDRLAEMIGLKGIYVDDPEQMGAAWDEAPASPMPVVINVPPSPPHITFEEAKQSVHALQQGDFDQPHLLSDAAA